MGADHTCFPNYSFHSLMPRKIQELSSSVLVVCILFLSLTGRQQQVPKVPRMTTMATRHMPTPKGGRYSLPTNTLSSILELKLFLATQGGRLRQQWIWLTERIKSI